MVAAQMFLVQVEAAHLRLGVSSDLGITSSSQHTSPPSPRETPDVDLLLTTASSPTGLEPSFLSVSQRCTFMQGVFQGSGIIDGVYCNGIGCLYC